MKDIVIPELAESILGGTISAWLVKVGDVVKEGDPIIELETDKIVVEVPSPYSGTITEIVAEEFEDVVIGQLVAKLSDQDEGNATPEENAASSDTKSEETADPETEAEDETDKEINTVSTKTEEVTLAEAKDIIPRKSPSQRRAEKIQQHSQSAQDNEKETKPAQVKEDNANKTEDLSKQTETKETVEESPFSQAALERNQAPENLSKPAEIERFSRRRQAIARNLVEAQQTMAMLTTFNEIDMSAVKKLRKKVQDNFVEKNNVKLGYISFFVKAVVGALKQFPAINSELQDNQLILKKYYDIGIAVSTDDGLVVPVVRSCDAKNFAEIELSIQEMAEKARTNELSLEDLQGGTFTITNGGIFGSTFSTPIINMPQAAILGMHNIVDRVVVKDGEFVTKPIMQVALTYDHRIVDGKDAASFLTTVKGLVEDPTKLLLEA